MLSAIKFGTAQFLTSNPPANTVCLALDFDDNKLYMITSECKVLLSDLMTAHLLDENGKIKQEYLDNGSIVEVPTKTSQLVNDSGFITKDTHTLTYYLTKDATFAEINKNVAYLNTKIEQEVLNLQNQINGLSGSYVYIGKIDSTNPTQEELTQAAMQFKGVVNVGYVIVDGSQREWYYDGSVWNDFGTASSEIVWDAIQNKPNLVEYQAIGKKTESIVLKNDQNLLGTDTNGSMYNLAMVSRWNKADFGSASIPMNLNSVSGVVTINDNKVVATVDQIPEIPEVDVDGIVAEASGAVVDYLGVQDVDGKIRFSQEKFPGMYSVSDYIPAAGDFVYLNNNAKIASDLLPDLEILLDGIFIGKDYGNLGQNQTLDNIVFHASNGGIAINAANGLVYIPTSEYASPSALVASLMGMEPSAQLAFIENHRVITVDGKIAARALPEEAVTIADIEATLEDYQTVAGMEDYAKKTYVDDKVAELGNAFKIVGKVDSVDALPSSAVPGNIYLIDEDGETAEYVFTEEQGWEKLGTTANVDLTGYATEEYVNAATSGKADKTEVTAGVAEAKAYADTQLTEAKSYADGKVAAGVAEAKAYTDTTLEAFDTEFISFSEKIAELQAKIEAI